MLMAPRLTENLIKLAGIYQKASGCMLSSLSKKAHSDSSFYDRLIEGEVSFSVRKYDQMLVWFRRNWPEGVEWPPHIRAPTRQEMRAVEAAAQASAERRARQD